MRDIKFRVWDKYNRHFNSDYAINGNLVWGACEADIIKEKEHLVFMQYTGLKDKNGKEIYEGDVVDYTGSEIPGDEHNYVQVAWGDLTGWELENYAMRIPEFYQEELEIIGNIYENPELLTN